MAYHVDTGWTISAQPKKTMPPYTAFTITGSPTDNSTKVWVTDAYGVTTDGPNIESAASLEAGYSFNLAVQQPNPGLYVQRVSDGHYYIQADPTTPLPDCRDANLFN